MSLQNIFFLIIILLFSSCDYGKLSFNDEMGYIHIKKVDINPIVLVINIKFNKNTNSKSNKDKSEEIVDKIKEDFNYRANTHFVYFYNLRPREILDIKNKHEKVLIIDMEIDKTLNYTILLDFLSVFLPSPAPQWGHYKFKILVEYYSNKTQKTHKVNYNIRSNFSYMVYPLYRYSEEMKALKKGVNKLLDEILENKDLAQFFDQNLNVNSDITVDFLLKEDGIRLVQMDTYSSFPLSIDFRYLYGVSTINGYYKNESKEYKLGSSGTGKIKEYKVQFSSYKPITKMYITPTLGYYHQEIEIRDFGYDTREKNAGKDGYISGRIEERDEDGNLIIRPDFNPYSLEYNSEFSSTYLGGKAGINLIFGNDIRFIFSPVLYFSIIEARNTKIIADGNQFAEWSFPLGGLIGLNLEFGVFFTKLHFGFKGGFDSIYFRQFDFKYKVKFNTVVESEYGLEMGKKIEVDRFSVFSNRWFFDLFVIF